MSMSEIVNSIEREAVERTMFPAPWDNLKEHRCPCGRLLGRFNGQAEVKCPKCGEVNLIGVEK